MSSTTSTDTLQPWQLFTLAGLVGATIVVFLSRGETPAGVILLSLTIFGAAAVGLAAWRTFAPLASEDDAAGPQMLGGRTRAALEREKSLVLRSIKELEFDRAMGKISEKDFGDMSARLRGRAAGLIRQLDAGTVYRDEIEKEIARRTKKPEHARAKSLVPDPESPIPAVSASACISCGTANDPDARFCKHCGQALGTTS